MKAVLNRVRHELERRAYIVARSRSRREGFAMFGGHRPRHYFSRIYFGERDHRLQVRCAATSVARRSRELLNELGLVVFCGSTTPAELEGSVLHLPGMMGLTMDTPPTEADAAFRWTRSARADISRIAREGYRYDVSTGAAFIDEFHAQFHVPAMISRHHAEAYTRSARELRRASERPGAELIRVWRDGLWVGGCTTEVLPSGYRLWGLGWRGGDRRLLKEGVVSAIYWFCIQRAAELRLPRLLLGAVSPTLEDGLLFFKGKWGGRFEPVRGQYGTFHLLLNPPHPVCGRFLQKHSLLCVGQSGEIVAFSAKRPQDMAIPPSIVSGISRWYRWLDQRRTVGDPDLPGIPATLRPWLVEEHPP